MYHQHGCHDVTCNLDAPDIAIDQPDTRYAGFLKNLSLSIFWILLCKVGVSFRIINHFNWLKSEVVYDILTRNNS